MTPKHESFLLFCFHAQKRGFGADQTVRRFKYLVLRTVCPTLSHRISRASVVGSSAPGRDAVQSSNQGVDPQQWEGVIVPGQGERAVVT